MVNKKQTPKVGMEEAWPVLFRVLGLVGLVMPKRLPSGVYKTAWERLIPVVLYSAAICWYLCTYPISLTEVAYDTVLTFTSYFVCSAYIVYAFTLAIYKRREEGRLLAAVRDQLPPAKAVHSFLLASLYVAFIAFFLYTNYIIGNWETVPWPYMVIMTSISPVFLTVIDFSLLSHIHVVRGVYQGALQRILAFSGLSRAQVQDSRPFSVTGWQIYSSLLFVRCGTFLTKILACVYYVVLFTSSSHLVFYASYLVAEVIAVYLICYQADSLKSDHEALEDALVILQQEPTISSKLRDRLLTHVIHLHRRPAHIKIANVGVMGSDVLLTLTNVALTYFVIAYQYRK